MYKKLITLCLVVAIFFGMAPNVYATRITLNQIRDVINAMPWNTGELAGKTANATVNGSRLVLTIDVAAAASIPAIQERLEFALNGNVLTTTVSHANLNLETPEGNARADARDLLLTTVVEMIGVTHGFNQNELTGLLQTNGASAFTIQQHGISIQEGEYDIVFSVDLSRRPAVGRFAATGDDPNHSGTTPQPDTNFETVSALVLFVIMPLGLAYYLASRRKMFFKL